MAKVTLTTNNSRLFAFLKDEKMTNVTLTAEGRMIKAHKLILAAASNYFEVNLRVNLSPRPET
jgi:BTB/POZ domain